MRVFAGVVFEKILVFNISGATKTTKEATGTMNNDTSHQTKSTEINFNLFLKMFPRPGDQNSYVQVSLQIFHIFASSW
jgi:hypothetical protein